MNNNNKPFRESVASAACPTIKSAAMDTITALPMTYASSSVGCRAAGNVTVTSRLPPRHASKGASNCHEVFVVCTAKDRLQPGARTSSGATGASNSSQIPLLANRYWAAIVDVD